MVDTSLEHKIRGAVKINGKEYDLYLNKERAVLKMFRDFINKDAPLKIITEYNSKNPIANFIRETLKTVQPNNLEEVDSIKNKELPLMDLLHILDNVPDIELRLKNKEVMFSIDCLNFTLFRHKVHYRYRWALYIGDDNKLIYEPVKTFKKNVETDKKLKYFIVFIKNIGAEYENDINVEKELDRDFLPIEFK